MVSLSVVNHSIAILNFNNLAEAVRKETIQLDADQSLLLIFTVSLNEQNRVTEISFDVDLLPDNYEDNIEVANHPDAVSVMLISKEKYIEADEPADLLVVKPCELYVKVIKGKIICIERMHGDDPISF